MAAQHIGGKERGILAYYAGIERKPGEIEEHSNVCNDRDCKIESVSR